MALYVQAAVGVFYFTQHKFVIFMHILEIKS